MFKGASTDRVELMLAVVTLLVAAAAISGCAHMGPPFPKWIQGCPGTGYLRAVIHSASRQRTTFWWERSEGDDLQMVEFRHLSEISGRF